MDIDSNWNLIEAFYSLFAIYFAYLTLVELQQKNRIIKTDSSKIFADY